MRLYFPVPAQAGPEGVLLRSFLRECRLSTDLLRAVKFHGGGFEAGGRPVLANQRVFPGQTVSFALPEEPGGCAPDPAIPVRVAYEDFFAAVLDKPAGIAVHPTLNYPGGTLANGYAAMRQAEGRSTVFRPTEKRLRWTPFCLHPPGCPRRILHLAEKLFHWTLCLSPRLEVLPSRRNRPPATAMTGRAILPATAFSFEIGRAHV